MKAFLQCLVILLNVNGEKAKPCMTLEECISLLRSDNRVDRAQGASWIADLEGDRSKAIPELINLLADHTSIGSEMLVNRSGERNEYSTSVCAEARDALIKIGTDAIDDLTLALDDDQMKLRALEALGEIGSPHTIIPKVSAILMDDKSELIVRWQAGVTLGMTKVVDVIPILCSLRNQEEPFLRGAGATGLGYLYTEQSIECLLDYLEDDVLGVRDSAMKSLKRLSGQDYGIDGNAWRRWWESHRN